MYICIQETVGGCCTVFMLMIKVWRNHVFSFFFRLPRATAFTSPDLLKIIDARAQSIDSFRLFFLKFFFYNNVCITRKHQQFDVSHRIQWTRHAQKPARVGIGNSEWTITAVWRHHSDNLPTPTTTPAYLAIAAHALLPALVDNTKYTHTNTDGTSYKSDRDINCTFFTWRD